jgi:hypothetical protein
MSTPNVSGSIAASLLLVAVAGCRSVPEAFGTLVVE